MSRLRALRSRGAVALLAGFALGAAAPAANAADSTAPRGAVGGIMNPASGTMTLNVRATDDGLGLASARASVDGTVVAAADLGGPGCGDLPPADPAIDAPPDGACPASVEGVQLAVPTPVFPDGPHQLQVSVTDGAGNSAVLVDQPFIINNTPPVQQSSALLTLGTAPSIGASPAAPSGPGAGAGAVGGTGGTAPGSRSACLAPRLSMFLKDKPLRVVKGVPVLRRNRRYRFTGTLTCAVGGRRVHAHSGQVVSLFNQIGRRTQRKRGVATRSDGTLSIILTYPSSRLLDFRYTSAEGAATRVRIRITVVAAAKHATKKKAR